MFMPTGSALSKACKKKGSLSMEAEVILYWSACKQERHRARQQSHSYIFQLTTTQIFFLTSSSILWPWLAGLSLPPFLPTTKLRKHFIAIIHFHLPYGRSFQSSSLYPCFSPPIYVLDYCCHHQRHWFSPWHGFFHDKTSIPLLLLYLPSCFVVRKRTYRILSRWRSWRRLS